MKRLLICCATAAAAVLSAGDPLLPMAAMAAEDGQTGFAESTARAVLSAEALPDSRRAEAEEILIRAAFARGDLDAAANAIETARHVAPDRLRLFRMTLLATREDYAGAAALYDPTLLPSDSPWGVAALRLMSMCESRLGRSAKAAEYCRAVAASPAATPTDLAANAAVWYGVERSPDAVAALLKTLGEADRGGAWLACATQADALTRGDPETRRRAAETLGEVLSLESLSPQVVTPLALAAAALNDGNDLSVTYARRAAETAKTDRDRFRALTALGRGLIASPGTAAEGVQRLTEAVRLTPSDPEAPSVLMCAAETLAAQGLAEQALEIYRLYLDSYDEPTLRVRILQGRGRALADAGRYDEAVSSFEAAARLMPESERAPLLTEAADAADAANRPQKALTLRRDIVRLAATPASELRLAQACEAAGEIDEAKRLYGLVRDAQNADPADRVAAVLRLGALLTAEGRLNEAIAEYTYARQRANDPLTQARLSLARGRAYHALGDAVSAQSDFRDAAKAADPSVASEGNFFLVLSLYSLGEDDRARRLAGEFAGRYPESGRIPDIALWLAKSEFNRGDYGAALKGFEDFVRRWPDDARVPLVLGVAAQAAYHAQDFLRAVELVGTLAQRAPEYPRLADARFLQCEALIELARYGEARELLDALIRRNPDATWLGSAYGLKGDCLYTTATDDASRYTQALDAYREAFGRLGEHPASAVMYLYKIGRTLEKMGRRDEAADQYMRLLYRLLARPAECSDAVVPWARKCLAQLRAIELARGNRIPFENLMQRIRQSGLPLS